MRKSIATRLIPCGMAMMFLQSAVAQSPTYLGRSSCGSATCHGGVAGQGPKWNSSLSVWEAHDAPHAGAGRVLLNEQSRRMVEVLEGGLPSLAGDDAGDGLSAAETRFHRILRERCVSCHAPAASASEMASPQWRQGIREGVSCESCHGPASDWLDLHTLENLGFRHSAFAHGMLPTENWSDRTDNCLRCHVGSRVQDGLVRDMNHDLIAAGHPALNFDMTAYLFKLPAHWSLDHSKSLPADSQRISSNAPGQPNRNVPGAAAEFELATPAQHETARLRAVLAAAKLSLERMQASSLGHAPAPEFAEYRCSDCHQNIGIPTADFERYGSGLGWNSFYTALTGLDPDLLRVTRLSQFERERESTKMAMLVTRIEERLNADRLAGEPARSTLADVAEVAIVEHGRADWDLAVTWLWLNRLVLLNMHSLSDSDSSSAVGAKVLPAREVERLLDLLNAFDAVLDGDRAASSPPVPPNAQGAISIDLDRLLDLYKSYQHEVSKLVGPNRESPTGASE